jgi:hypothetical protein
MNALDADSGVAESAGFVILTTCQRPRYRHSRGSGQYWCSVVTCLAFGGRGVSEDRHYSAVVGHLTCR